MSTVTIGDGQARSSMLRTVGMTTAAVGAVLGLLALKYPNCALFDEEREGVNNVRGVPIFGCVFRLLKNKDTILDFLNTCFEEDDCMTTTASSLGLPRSVATIHPKNIEYILKDNFENYVKGPQLSDATIDLFGHGIFNANGEKWKYQRKTASHIFNVKNFRDHFTDVFVQHLFVAESEILDKYAANGQSVDFQDLMFRFTLDSFVQLGFGVRLNTLASEEKVAFAQSFDAIQVNAFNRFINPVWPVTERLQAMLLPWKMTVGDHSRVIDTFAISVIEGRRKQLTEGGEYRDLLSRFMNARNEHGELLSNRELRDIILNFIVAGRDTTAEVLSWTLYNLMTHPEIEEKLLAEINENITSELEYDSPALYQVIKEMKYAHAVFYEVLRLHPSVPTNQKYALKDDVWPDGTPIRKGDYVLWCPWAQGRSTKIWGPDAKEFKPERWILPNGDLRRESQGQWPAFHAGPRVCLGQNLATLEALVAIAFLLRRYKFTLVPDQEITYQVSLTLPMKNGMQVYVNKRTD